MVRFIIMAGYKNNIESFHSVSSPKNQSKSQRMNEVDVFVWSIWSNRWSPACAESELETFAPSKLLSRQACSTAISRHTYRSFTPFNNNTVISSPGHSAQLLSCRQSHEYNSEPSSTTWPHRHRVSNNISPNYFVSNLSNLLSFRLFKQNKSRSWNLGDMLLGLKPFQCSLLLCFQKQTLTSLSFTSRFVCIRSDKVVISQSLFIQLTINYTKAIQVPSWNLISNKTLKQRKV